MAESCRRSRSPYLYGNITRTILQRYTFVFERLTGRLWLEEKHISSVLASELRSRGLLVEEHVPVAFKFQDVDMGTKYIDLLVENSVVLELKRIRMLKEQHRDQLRAYLRYGAYAVGLLLNFGSNEPDFNRVENPEAFLPDWRGH